jgi:hypothetical protein
VTVTWCQIEKERERESSSSSRILRKVIFVPIPKRLCCVAILQSKQTGENKTKRNLVELQHDFVQNAESVSVDRQLINNIVGSNNVLTRHIESIVDAKGTTNFHKI